jgi:hypothetical protein
MVKIADVYKNMNKKKKKNVTPIFLINTFITVLKIR